MLDVVDLTEELIDIPSVSGAEGPIMEHVAGMLERGGWSVERQPVSPGRCNVWAKRKGGGVTLSTHLDTVGPHVSAERRQGRIHGRGACDAKGICASMICAAERLARKGEERVDLLFVVGEEAGSDGARAANTLPATSRFLVNGEPTESTLASAAKGSLRVHVTTEGRAAHSAYPALGDSAIESMVALLADLEARTWPADAVLGSTTVNVGTIEGGTAANVIPAACTAELLVRLVGDAEAVVEQLEEWARGRASLTFGARQAPQRFHTLPGFESKPVAFTSDALLLGAWGTPLMFGPGSIHDAHTPDEHVEMDDLIASVDTYERLVEELLGP